MATDNHTLTLLMESVRNGDVSASHELIARSYSELRFLAENQLKRERNDHTLQATALINEAFLRLFPEGQSPSWENRTHFFGSAAEAMRRVLVDYARMKAARKRGSELERQYVDLKAVKDDSAEAEKNLTEILEVDEALRRFFAHDSSKAELVRLRYFGGLTLEESAEVLGVSRATACRHWAYAKAWLMDEIERTRHAK